MTPLTVFEEFRFVWELLVMNFTFLLPFARKKPHFAPKVVLGVAALTVFSLIRFPVLELQDYLPELVFTGTVASIYILQALLMMLFTRLCFSLTVTDALYFCISAYSGQHIIYVLVHELLAQKFWIALTENVPMYTLISLEVTCLLVLLIYALFAPALRLCGGQMYSDTPGWIAFHMGLLVVEFFCTFLCQEMFSYSEKYAVWGAILGILVCILILCIQRGTLTAVRIAQERAVIEQTLRDNARRYAMSRELVEHINRTCHDLKHNLQVLKTIDEAERQSYIEETERRIEQYHELHQCEDEVLNTILAEQSLACRKRDVKLVCSVDGGGLDFISVPDLYAILGNAIDNAVECARQFEDPEKRVISLTIHADGGFVSIQTNNYCDGELQREGGLPVTTKADKASHGFGLKSIRYLARKYGGELCVEVENGIFILQVVLPRNNDTVKAALA